MSYNAALLHNELKAAGIAVDGCNAKGNVQYSAGDPSVVDKVKAAHNKTLDSLEGVALSKAISAEQWTAYQNARKGPVELDREAKYQEKTDRLRDKALEAWALAGGQYTAEVKAAFDEWTQAKDAIRAELPYPE